MPTPANVVAGLSAAAVIFAAGYMANRRPPPVASSDAVRQVLYYACPICGMRLVAAYTGGKPDPATADPPGMLKVSAATQQLIGVRTDEVRRTHASYLLRLPGRITVDDARLYRIVAATDGWIRELGQNTVGTSVKKDQVLASYYTSGLLNASQTLLYAMAANAQTGDGYLGAQRSPTAFSLQSAIDSLRSLGMSESQIDEIRRTRQAAPVIHIYSPITGFVLARNISPEQRFDKGIELYRIADIGHVWVMADIFEQDLRFARPGALATVRYGGHEFTARMSDALPQLDSESRTLKIRFELDNLGNVLRPNMFVDVEVQVKMPAAVVVPADAVVDSGRGKTVFVERSSGVFEPVLVETGWRLGDRVEITKGLDPGERIVVSGNFLIDSESRMKH